MSTTIQIKEDIDVGASIEIGGKMCRVECFSHSAALIEKAWFRELFDLMSNELIERDVIQKNDQGELVWYASDKPLVSKEDF